MSKILSVPFPERRKKKLSSSISFQVKYLSDCPFEKQFQPNPQYVIPSPSGSYSFFNFNGGVYWCDTYPAGEVFLLYGKHWNTHNGYGLSHILKGHSNEFGISRNDSEGIQAQKVSRAIGEILVAKAGVYREEPSYGKLGKLCIIKNSKGSVFIEHRTDSVTGLSYYSVVTAMRNTKAKGTQVDAL